MNSIHEGWCDDFRVLNFAAPEGVSCTHRIVPSSLCCVPEQDIDKNGMLKFRRAILFFFVILALCAGVNSSRAGNADPSEPQLKAAFLLNFPKYVEWPANTFARTDSPIVVGIFGDEDVASEFSAMSQGKVIEGHTIHFVRVTTVSQCRGCHILFVSSSVTQKLPEILPTLQNANVLTVGESEEFLNLGGMINLSRHERRISIEVNADAAHQTQLKISSKLMALATVKGGKK